MAIRCLWYAGILSMVALAGCQATKQPALNYTSAQASSTGIGFFDLLETASDEHYGYAQTHPIDVGGHSKNEGALNEQKYLNGLRGPNGQDIKYARTGICCPFQTLNAVGGSGHLDHYVLTWEGQKKPITLYLNMYDEGPLYVPKGLTKAQVKAEMKQ